MNPNQVLTVKEMRALEQKTCALKSISNHALMLHAGLRLYEYIKSNILLSQKEKILILAGIGNNGGDALVIAQYLIKDGFDVDIFIIGTLQNVSLDMAIELKKVAYTELNAASFAHFKESVSNYTICIDGIFGFGFREPLDAFTRQVIEHINQHDLNVIAIDIPSGLNAHNGLKSLSIKASQTLIIGHYKPGNLLGDALDVHGQTALIDIDLTHHVSQINRIKLLDADFNELFSPRLRNSHKYHYGHVLVLGGSLGMMGAPILAAHAALVCGAGLVSVAYQSDFYPFRIECMPEIMSRPYEDTNELKHLLANKKALVFGMGLNQSTDVLKSLKVCINQGIPMVIDAGGFHHLKTLMKDINDPSTIVLTPHMKELADLLSIDIDTIKKDALMHVETLAQKTGMTVVLKGPTTLISNGIYTYFISAGNPGLAKAGSGDVLSGIIGALLANGYAALDAAKIGVYLHGKAADHAKDDLGERSMLATDVIKRLPDAIKKITLK